MKLKTKPTKPVRKVIDKKEQIVEYTFSNAKDLLNYLLDMQTKGFDLLQVGLETEYGYEYSETYLKWKELESEEDYEKRLKSYQKKLDEYNKWYSDNRLAIELELKVREEHAKAKKDKEIATLEKRLSKLKEGK